MNTQEFLSKTSAKSSADYKIRVQMLSAEFAEKFFTSHLAISQEFNFNSELMNKFVIDLFCTIGGLILESIRATLDSTELVLIAEVMVGLEKCMQGNRVWLTEKKAEFDKKQGYKK